MELAHELGMTLGRLRLELVPGEFRLWQGFRRIVPFMAEREAREDTRAARTPLILASVHRAKGAADPKLEDFIVDWHGKARPAQDARALADGIRSWARGHNAALKRKRAARGTDDSA